MGRPKLMCLPHEPHALQVMVCAEPPEVMDNTRPLLPWPFSPPQQIFRASPANYLFLSLLKICSFLVMGGAPTDYQSHR